MSVMAIESGSLLTNWKSCDFVNLSTRVLPHRIHLWRALPEIVWWRRAYRDTSRMMERPQPSCSDPNGWRLLINIDGVFIGMAVGLNYSVGSGRHMGRPLQ